MGNAGERGFTDISREKWAGKLEGWKLEVGELEGWKLEVGELESWKLEVGELVAGELVAGGWNLEAGGWKLEELYQRLYQEEDQGIQGRKKLLVRMRGSS